MSVRSMDRAVFVLGATVTHQVGHAQQLLHTGLRPMNRAVSANEPNARYAHGLQQQPLCKHHYPNDNRESEAIGGQPNCQTSQLTYIPFPLRLIRPLVTTMPVLHLTSSQRCTTGLEFGGRVTEIDGSHSPQIENGPEESPKWFRAMHRPNH